MYTEHTEHSADQVTHCSTVFATGCNELGDYPTPLLRALSHRNTIVNQSDHVTNRQVLFQHRKHSATRNTAGVQHSSRPRKYEADPKIQQVLTVCTNAIAHFKMIKLAWIIGMFQDSEEVRFSNLKTPENKTLGAIQDHQENGISREPRLYE